jgi:hypothetical protein
MMGANARNSKISNYDGSEVVMPCFSTLKADWLGRGDSNDIFHSYWQRCFGMVGKFDGGAKTHQLLRCCNCSRHCGVPKYASFLDNCAPCIWRFLLSHSLFGFLAKASSLVLEKEKGCKHRPEARNQEGRFSGPEGERGERRRCCFSDLRSFLDVCSAFAKGSV